MFKSRNGEQKKNYWTYLFWDMEWNLKAMNK